MTVARTALAGAALAGCNGENTVVTNAKSAAPLSPQLVSLMTEKGMSPRDPMLVRIFKEESKAEVWKKRQGDGRYALLKSYDICRFSGKLGPKIKEGDKQAPEGFYQVTPAQMNPKSSYYLSFNIGFPNAHDKALGRTGQHVMMHGDCLSAGCYAMTDEQMGEIYAMARESFRGGQPAFQVQAMPFRMTPQNIARRRTDKNMPFWKNLKQGSDAFEVTKLEPRVDACGKKYVFNAQAGGLQSFNPSAGCPSYEVEPTIAKAVAAKEKADNAVIAALSRTEPLAPEYVAQNGRLRRTLDQPVVMVAAVAPEAAGAPMIGSLSQTAPGGMALAVSPVAPAARPVDIAVKAAPAAAPAALPVQIASARPTDVKSTASTGLRQIAVDESPVMATAVSPTSSGGGGIGAVGKLKGWVGGLIGGSKPEEAQAAAPVVTEPTPAAYTPPVGATAKRNRSAALPDQFAPKAKTDRTVTSSSAPTE